MLLNSGMLENAYLLEMMSNLGGTSGITKNQCLRQPTSAALTDSVSYFQQISCHAATMSKEMTTEIW